MSLIQNRNPLLMLSLQLYPSKLPLRMMATPCHLDRNLLSWSSSIPPPHASGRCRQALVLRAVLVHLPVSGPLTCSPLYLGLPVSENIARGRILSHLKDGQRFNPSCLCKEACIKTQKGKIQRAQSFQAGEHGKVLGGVGNRPPHRHTGIWSQNQSQPLWVSSQHMCLLSLSSQCC